MRLAWLYLLLVISASSTSLLVVHPRLQSGLQALHCSLVSLLEMLHPHPGLQGISLPCHALLALLVSLLTEQTMTTPSGVPAMFTSGLGLLASLPGLGRMLSLMSGLRQTLPVLTGLQIGAQMFPRLQSGLQMCPRLRQ